MKKQCRRKIYQLVNPIQFAIDGAAITPEAELNLLRMRELSAIDAFAHGWATEQDWHEVSAMNAIAWRLAINGFGVEVIQICQGVKVHLDEADARFKRIGKMGSTGPALQAFRDLYQFHDLQRQSIARSDYENAISEAVKRVKFVKQEAKRVKA